VLQQRAKKTKKSKWPLSRHHVSSNHFGHSFLLFHMRYARSSTKVSLLTFWLFTHSHSIRLHQWTRVGGWDTGPKIPNCLIHFPPLLRTSSQVPPSCPCAPARVDPGKGLRRMEIWLITIKCHPQNFHAPLSASLKSSTC